MNEVPDLRKLKKTERGAFKIYKHHQRIASNSETDSALLARWQHEATQEERKRCFSQATSHTERRMQSKVDTGKELNATERKWVASKTEEAFLAREAARAARRAEHEPPSGSMRDD